MIQVRRWGLLNTQARNTRGMPVRQLPLQTLHPPVQKTDLDGEKQFTSPF
jgi:hypothetical protein